MNRFAINIILKLLKLNRISFKDMLPHIIAFAVFLLTTIIFCKPAIESGVVLKQGDVTSWQGMSHQSIEYAEKNGHFPLWTVSMFSGMPSYQIAMKGPWSPVSIFEKFTQL